MNGITQGQLARYIASSTNKKTGSDVTYVTLMSCDKSCALYNNGCYAQNYPMRFHVAPLDEEGATSTDIAKAEARAIDESYGGGDVPKGTALRLHVSGDARTKSAAKTLGEAVKRWRGRGGEHCWTYTHAWKKVPRSAWTESISILASIERAEDAKEVLAQGYAPAIVVADFPKAGKAFEAGGVKFVPCPAQIAEDKTCADCRLCWDADRLAKKNMGIAFEAHGSKANTVKRHLAVLQEA
jgi:hypothetical protein